jgi:hypothetical protein
MHACQYFNQRTRYGIATVRADYITHVTADTGVAAPGRRSASGSPHKSGLYHCERHFTQRQKWLIANPDALF